MAQKYLSYALLSILLLTLLAGCSGSNSLVLSSSDQPVQPIIADEIQSSNGRVIWGAWKITFDPGTGNAVIVADRQMMSHYNVNQMILPPKCKDCITVKINSIDNVTHIWSVQAILKNPTANVAGYDVRGTLLFPAGDTRKLTNADAYTTILANSTKSPFKAFAKDQPQRQFAPKATWSEEYRILFPEPANLSITYVVDASYPSNQVEPYSISNTYMDGAVYDNGYSDGCLYATVSDWQSDIESVQVDLSSIGGTSADMQSIGGGFYKGLIGNDALKPAGTYTLWIHAKSIGSSYELYSQFELTIQPYPEASYPPSAGQLGLLYNSPLAYDGYTLMAPKHYNVTYLLDNQGRVCHKWTSTYKPGETVYILPNGHLLRDCAVPESQGGRIEEYDWDGNVVWSYHFSNGTDYMHHDIMPLPNGNIIAIASETKTKAELIAAGFDSNLLKDSTYNPDYIVEIQPVGSTGGTIVWQWHTWDHMVQDNDAGKPNYGVVSEHPELINVDGEGKVTSFIHHMNAIDYNAGFDQILVSVRNFSEVWVIDHGTTTAEAASHTGGKYGKGGDLLYRWGNPLTYGEGSSSDEKFFDQHDGQWIRSGCPGEGHIMVYNNGVGRPDGKYSSVDEIIPPVNSDGTYNYTAGSPYAPVAQTWIWKAPNPTDMYGDGIGGCQRQPNGNTLICDGVHGIFIEVTSGGEIVWLYVNPVTDQGPLHQGDVPPLDGQGHQMNAVFVIQRYAKDYQGFSSKDLTPGDPLV